MKSPLTLEQRLDKIMELIRAAGYYPSVTVTSAKLPASLCKQYRITVSKADRETMRANNVRPEHHSVDCWNIMVLASGGCPLVPGGLYCNSIQEGLEIMDQMTRKFCRQYWKGEGKRPTKRALGIS